MNLLRQMVDGKHSLEDMALLVRRAGLEHLVEDPSEAEVRALADAGDRFVLWKIAALIAGLEHPAEVLRPFDGGERLKAEVKALAYALSDGGAS